MASAAAPGDPVWTPAAMEARVVRYADLRPCFNAFVDTRSPGSEAKENFTIIGPGVSENPDQYVHIAEPHGFNIGGARQPPGCVNSQHSHDTAEVFVVHSGEWSFNLGETGEEVQVRCGPGDVISLPTGMFRGFTNVGKNVGYLFAVLGMDDPGRVTWAPYVFDMAKDYGLVLLENGMLVDTAAGQSVPVDIEPMPRTSADQVSVMTIPTLEEAEALVWRSVQSDQTRETPVIGSAAPLQADNGIRMTRLDLLGGASFDIGIARTPEVLFVHSGTAELEWADGTLPLGIGDTVTVPIGLSHRINSESGAILYKVGG
jgi:mannose-6-phosphate isomerase-like protein (cupin superfamily)